MTSTAPSAQPLLTETAAWRALQAHREGFTASLVDLFDRDPQRAERFCLDAVGFCYDFSKQRIDQRALSLLLELAAERRLEQQIARLFAGETVNPTEGRPALHMALRAQPGDGVGGDGGAVVGQVQATLARMASFVDSVRSGEWTGFSGRPISDVVNIGIGGSDLGPRLLCEALGPGADGPRVHFLSTVDGAHVRCVLSALAPDSTLFLVTSKSFSTVETLANARTARRWLEQAGVGRDALSRHMVAVSANKATVAEFGLSAEQAFEFWPWVGGRYSVWSAVGLPVALSAGMEAFRALLAGARAMDRHFRSAPLAANLPVLMGLLGLWNRHFHGYDSQIVVAYSRLLERLPAYLQQLEMESNGKGVTRDGRPVPCRTVPAIWGGAGTDTQHAFFQRLHQGPDALPVDLIVPVEPEPGFEHLHRLLIANALAQGEALMRGKNADQVRAELSARGLSGARLEAAIPHRCFPGDRPTSTLLVPDAGAHALGALLALYEHKVFVQSVIWDINAFDQWGVELGKTLADSLLAAMDGEGLEAHDASTQRLLKRCLRAQ